MKRLFYILLGQNQIKSLGSLAMAQTLSKTQKTVINGNYPGKFTQIFDICSKKKKKVRKH
mgnify:CR=1 FL=1